MKIFWYIIAALRGLGILLTMILFLLFYAFSRIFLKHTKASGLRLRRVWITYVAYPILNLKVKVEGTPPKEAALYVSNHRSFTDPIVVSKFIDAFVIAKAEVASYPVINKGAEVTGILYVKRSDKNSRTETRKAFVDVIRAGYNILVYPEGTISTNKSPLPFKKGTFYEAAKEGIKIVPVAIEFKNEKDLWTIHNFIGQYFNQFSKWKTEVKLTFGPLMQSHNGDDIYEEAYDWIEKELHSMQEGWAEIEWKA
ncbi:MAG: lysophospholipid acyltransferase family protein [Saprospiraceae bacterium]|nr:lysophospholipid acyltransferase family protein [Saprospiraceae bacterium]